LARFAVAGAVFRVSGLRPAGTIDGWTLSCAEATLDGGAPRILRHSQQRVPLAQE